MSLPSPPRTAEAEGAASRSATVPAASEVGPARVNSGRGSGWLRDHPRALATAGIVAVLALTTLRLLSPESALGRALVRTSYNTSFSLTAPWRPTLRDSPVVIVYLDLESYLREKQNPAEPWSRALHARLLRRLTRAGARAVVFDIIFSDPGPDLEADRQFAEAIRANGRVILGAELNPSSENTGQAEWVRSLTALLPEPHLRAAAAGWGIAYTGVDEDFVVRRQFPGFLAEGQPSLVWSTARLLGLAVARPGLTNPPPRWVYYYGGPLTVPHVSYSQALDPNGVADAFFRDRIVFVGARPMVGAFTERRDEQRSPFSGWSDKGLFMPGVEVHATQMLNLLRQDGLGRPSENCEAGLLLGLGVLAGVGLFRFRPVAATALALLANALLLGITLWFFAHDRLWWPWLITAAVQIPTALGGSVLFESAEWYRQRRRLEAQRRAAEAKIKEQAALIEEAQDAILVQNLAGQIVYANPSALQLYGWTPAELESEATARQLFAPSAAQVAEARQTVLAEGRWVGELHQATRRGQTVVAASRWTLIRQEDGQPKSILLINTDITEKKRLEARFLRTQRVETIGALAGGMAHDLNNALAPILMGIQLLRKHQRDAPTQRMLGIMEASTHRGADMVRQVLWFCRGDEGEQQALTLAGLLEEIERVIRQTFPKSISLAVMTPPDLWPIKGNPTQLHQVLLNLCVNARDAMPQGGKLTLAVDNVQLSQEEAEAIPRGQPGAYVMVLVADTGVGIPLENLPRIFDPFFTTKAPGQGTGLGLSTTARIVALHGGFLNVTSEVGEGTTFELYLPRAPAGTRPAAPAAPAELPRGAGELILFVDDERSVREMIAPVLTDYGYRALCAGDGVEGLALLGQRGEEVRLVMLDMTMPLWDGRKALAALRQQHPRLPVIVMSGESAPPVGTAGLDGPVAFLAKPFRLEQVLALIARMLQGPDSGAGNDA